MCVSAAFTLLLLPSLLRIGEGASRPAAERGEAPAILRSIDTGRVRVVQPPHFLAEVAAVLAREQPATAEAPGGDLDGVSCWT